MIEIKFPADRADIALAVGKALIEISRQPAPDHGDPTDHVWEKTPEFMRAEAGDEMDEDLADTVHAAAEVLRENPAAVREAVDATAEVDMNGVAFNPAFCGTAAIPFYGSGKRKGQWKKRKGVAEEDYDQWYEESEPAAAPPEEVITDTAAAFAPPAAAVETPSNAPTDCGSFMGWVSEKQAASLITQQDIGEAYTKAGVQVTDLFPPTPEADVARNVAALYELLSAKAGA